MLGGFLTAIMFGAMGIGSVANGIKDREIEESNRKHSEANGCPVYSNIKNQKFLTSNGRRVYEWIDVNTGDHWYKDSKTGELMLNCSQYYRDKNLAAGVEKAKAEGKPLVFVSTTYKGMKRNWMQDIETGERFNANTYHNEMASIRKENESRVYHRYTLITFDGCLTNLHHRPEDVMWIKCCHYKYLEQGGYPECSEEWFKMKQGEFKDFLKTEEEKYGMKREEGRGY